MLQPLLSTLPLSTAPAAERRHAPGQWLAQLPPIAFGLYAGLMAFGVYFAMYAFRKPFTVGDFGALTIWGVDYKIVLVIAQVVGYALSKMIGVKIIAELPAHRRVLGILAQIGLAELALVGFALFPAPWNAACLFVNGLALGMIWGMVFAFVEGRRQSELITAILCASFILSSGVVKSVGEGLLLRGISAFWMPALTGAIFAPVLLACLYGLAILPAPTAQDIAERVERTPMDAAARARLWQRYALGLSGLILLYIMLTALRDFRDNFSAEIWREAGLGRQADIFAWTELPVSLAVLGALAALMGFRDNRRALTANFMLMGFGLALAGGSSLGFAAHLLGPVAWMILLGAGLYLAYTPFNGILFDRLVATGGTPGNAGFLIYVADAFGYGGTVALLLLRNLPRLQLGWTHFLMTVSLITSALGMALLVAAWFYFDRRMTA
ncbi:DUF5690 family protein [Novosphingobium terrae]|uniref:DUF5690 family protein n=1 Tax=Novosphingobium terrae TaxID=2726189 RepID=UPI001F12B160|nr:DUF5690 family protein [Novosphingobium terrae]